MPSLLFSALSNDLATQSHVKLGLQAIAPTYRGKLIFPDTRLINASLDIDKTLKKEQPEDSRWDYAIEYNGNVLMVEFHGASTSEINCIVKKATWIKTWLKSHPDVLKALLGAPNYFLYWVSTYSTSIRILPRSREAKTLAINKIKHVGTVFDYNKLK